MNVALNVAVCPLLQGAEGADSLDLKVKDDGTTIEDIKVRCVFNTL